MEQSYGYEVRWPVLRVLHARRAGPEYAIRVVALAGE